MQEKARIAIFGGTFDPLHIGHMALANLALYRSPMPLKAICLVPTMQNPLKKDETLLSFDFRCKMIEATIANDRRFFYSRIEEQLPAPHYTIDLLDHFAKRFSQFSFVLLIGADNWLNFHNWHRYEELLERYELIIYPRKGFSIDVASLPNNVYYLSNFPLIEIASTDIREAIKRGEDLRYLIPSPELFPLLRKEIALSERGIK